MNEKKIAFIICANNELYYEECVWYIHQLEIPEEYETDIICITDAKSMTEAYNAAMENSDAKYKVYMHQDVFIYHKEFIGDIIRIFQSDEKLGMLGLIGGKNLPEDAEIWNAWNCGSSYVNNSKAAFLHDVNEAEEKGDCIEVEAIDGMLMVTQYDIRWREDLELGWDYYDVSQSLEFRRNGYKVGVVIQQEPWVMHDCGYSKLDHYDEAREKIIREYDDYFLQPYEPRYNLELMELEQQIFMQLKWCIEQSDLEQAKKIADTIRERKTTNTSLQYALNVMEIVAVEEEQKVPIGFLSNLPTWEEIKNKYDEIKFILRHAERETCKERVNELVEIINSGMISKAAIIVIINHTIVDKNAAAKRVMPKEFT